MALRIAAAEAWGTFALVFAGTGAIVINDVSGGSVTHPGIALTFGLVVLAMIYSLGEVSGAHLNPAVSLGFAAAGRLPAARVPLYVGAQLVGAVLASLVLHGLFPTHKTLGGTLPAGPDAQSFVLEPCHTWGNAAVLRGRGAADVRGAGVLLLTMILMFAILSVSVGAKEKGLTAGIVVGAVVALEAMFAGPICGASMNPARSLGPALVSGQLEHLYIYLLAPVLGALLAIPLWRLIHAPEASSPL